MAKRKINIEWRKLILELLVVFLGVTAGFILNNWRSERQEHKLEKLYINGFKADVETNISTLKERIEADSIWTERLMPLLEQVYKKNIVVDSTVVIMDSIVLASKLSLQSSTYDDIVNSGNLNLIRDFNLRSNIVEYYSAMREIEYFDGHFNKYFNDFVMQFAMSEFSMLDKKFKNPKIIHDIRFENVFGGYFSMVQQRKRIYESVLVKSKEVNSLLKAYNP